MNKTQAELQPSSAVPEPESDADLGDLSAHAPNPDEVGLTDEPIITVSYRHKGINHFVVGEFEFVNHLLIISGTKAFVAEKVAAFVELYKGLHASDKIAIVKLKNVQNEEAVDSVPRTVRGPVGTHQIGDREVGGEGIGLSKAPGGADAPKPAAVKGFNFRMGK